MGKTIQAGSFVTSYNTITKETGLTLAETRTCITKLKKTGELTSKTTNKYTLISLCNWEKYQSHGEQSNKQNDKPTTNEQQMNNKRTTTTKEIKEKKETKEGKERESDTQSKIPPDLSVIENYFFGKNIRNHKAEALRFFNYYESNGWNVGNNKMQKWKPAADRWISNGTNSISEPGDGITFDQLEEDFLNNFSMKEDLMRKHGMNEATYDKILDNWLTDRKVAEDWNFKQGPTGKLLKRTQSDLRAYFMNYLKIEYEKIKAQNNGKPARITTFDDAVGRMLGEQ